ncbi:alpha-E domain-containing protein [uncultured Gimesia sp.]|uniref:alpha-E domain-containing protein n=1 Tax=uncultured Gimesia sp. TaxID=1678688 RepID=UPI0030DC00E0|tara:strand:+ start:49309 stop:50310 length:1002 start_codon:yes stop_codon:yes gene_type:complete
MLSRVASSVYWLSRYVERAENVARFIDVNYNLTLGETDTLGNQWAPLIFTTGDQATFEERYESFTRKNVLKFLLFDEKNPNSILSCAALARENARTIREIIPSVVWEQLNQFYFMVRSSAGLETTQDQPQEFCERVRLASHMLVGATDSTMSHGESWHFARVGRMIERADKTSRIVDVQYYILLPDANDVGSALDVVRWSALLQSASALAMYRRQYGKILPDHVADFLVLDSRFPRSMHFCLAKAQQSLRSITGSTAGTFLNLTEQRIGLLCSNMDYTSVDNIIEQGLHQYIDGFQKQLNLVGEAIQNDFFISKQSPQTQVQARQTASQTQSS